MVAVLQRVSRGKVSVNGRTAGEIGPGLVIFLGVFDDDEQKDGEFLAQKISGFRIFNDNEGKMNLSVRDVSGSALVISQFTLCADWRRGRRPGFTRAALPEKARSLYVHFIDELKKSGIPVESGIFGTMMQVSLTNEGPATFVLDTNILN